MVNCNNINKYDINKILYKYNKFVIKISADEGNYNSFLGEIIMPN